MAWYGDRTSIWLPKTRDQFDALSTLASAQGNPPAGVLLTPFTTDLKLSSEILDGQYSDWADLIPRGGLAQFQVDTMAKSDFPFTVPHQLYPKNEIIFYSDRPRFERLASARIAPPPTPFPARQPIHSKAPLSLRNAGVSISDPRLFVDHVEHLDHARTASSPERITAHRHFPRILDTRIV